ncbi:MAG: hypothetical protein KC656_18690 [Myxococcales bacterium]|nr:hypothetical protein [Myxococcales bacterium]
MFLLTLLACDPCAHPDEPPSCEAAAYGPDYEPIAAPGDTIRGVFGLQGGIHIDTAVSVVAMSAGVELEGRILDGEGTVVATTSLVDQRARPDATCAADLEPVQVRFEDLTVACDMDGQPVTVEIQATRRDGEVATCRSEGVLELEDIAWDVFCTE